MTTSPRLAEAFGAEESGSGNHLPGAARQGETDRSMRILQEVSAALGIPVDAFLNAGGRPAAADDTLTDDVADLTRSFLAITDPVMRRYCLDVVRAASTENSRATPT